MNQSEKFSYKSISTIPVANFYLLNKHNNLAYLYKDYEDFLDEKMSKEETSRLKEIQYSITEDYIDILAEGKGRSDLLILGQMSDLESEILVVGSLILMVRTNPSEDLKTCLKDWKYPVDPDKAEKKLSGVQFKLSILRSKNKHLLEKDENEEEVEYDLYKDVVMLEQSLGGIHIDPKTTVLEKWVNYLKFARDKNKKAQDGAKRSS